MTHVGFFCSYLLTVAKNKMNNNKSNKLCYVIREEEKDRWSIVYSFYEANDFVLLL